jgi:hypothetical protein
VRTPILFSPNNVRNVLGRLPSVAALLPDPAVEGVPSDAFPGVLRKTEREVYRWIANRATPISSARQCHWASPHTASSANSKYLICCVPQPRIAPSSTKSHNRGTRRLTSVVTRTRVAVVAIAAATALLGTACGGRNDTSKEEHELALGVLKAAHAQYALDLLAAHGDVKSALKATDDYLQLTTLGLSDDEVANTLTIDAVVADRVCAPCARKLKEAAAQIRAPGEFGTTTP